MPAPIISAPTSSRYAVAYLSSTPVVPAPVVSPSTRSRNVRVAVLESTSRYQSFPSGSS